MLATALADPLDALRLARAVARQAVMVKFGQICVVGAALTHTTRIMTSVFIHAAQHSPACLDRQPIQLLCFVGTAGQ